jgi:hypothetical protein
MKALLRIVLAALLAASAMGAHAQGAYGGGNAAPGELEALLAPVALYPDPLLAQVLDASLHPADVAAAAAWARANPQLSGDAALATVQNTPWAPSVKALAAYPEVLARMAESPQWLHDLGEAYAADGPEVMATVQDLRARAQASGYLQSNGQQSVTEQGQAIVVQPAYPNVVYVPWYDPTVVYGGWIWAYRPVIWRPWIVRPHIVTRVVFAPRVNWFVHPGFVHHVEPPHHFVPRVPAPVVRGGPTIRPFHPVPESRRAPIVHSGGPAFIRSDGRAFVHSDGRAFIHSGPRMDGGHFENRSAASGGSRWQGHGAGRGHAGRR